MARKSPKPASACIRGISPAGFLALAALALVAGCAAPGAPVTREPRVPQAIRDLSARQSGDSIVLSFKLPAETAQGRKLSKTPAVEIYRAIASPQSSGEAPPQLEVTIPPQVIGEYVEDGEFRFADALAPAELEANSGGEAVYMARTTLGRHESADSNVVRVKIFPAPQPITDLRARITQMSVELSWTVPAIPGEASTPAVGIRYRVYRAEMKPGNSAAANGNAKIGTSEPLLLAETSAPSYSDTKVEFGKTCAYSVRSVAVYATGTVESAESNVLNVTPRDTFAPLAPTGLTAIALGASGSKAAHVDLSWAISSESDLAGYNVYRSDAENAEGARLNAVPVMTPVFRDNSVETGKKYFYYVTAVDRAGNESARSAAAAVSVPSGE